MKTKLICSAILLSAFVLTSNAFAQNFRCVSTNLEYLKNEKLILTAILTGPRSISKILLQMGSDLSSSGNLVKLDGPILGKKSSSIHNVEMTRFDISESKQDSVILYMPTNILSPNFQAKLRISFDDGYPLEKAMNCSL